MKVKNGENMSKSKNNATVNNETKVNDNAFINDLYNDLNKCTCKLDMVNAYKKVGIECVTSPTTTPNTTDLYAQFNRVNCGDLSRIRIKKSVIDAFFTDKVNDVIETDKKFISVSVNDGGKRNHKITMKNTFDNFEYIINVYRKCGIITK